MKNLKGTGLFLLAIIFSIALMFAFIELPRLIDSMLQTKVGFPGFDQGADEFNAYKSDLFVNALYLRWIGYGSLALIVAFIIIGFVTKKSGWAYAGAFALFLPVFGQFALSMFFLAGLGILRVVWLPFMDVSFNVLQLGNIIFLPYDILIWLAGLFNWDAHNFLAYFFMATGAFLFVWGVLIWLQTRFGGKGVAANAIYKFSRHPQYLGWIIWSYGMVLFSFHINNMKISWSVSSSLPWLLATMVIVGICLIEEIKMKERNGEEYEKYRAKTPFLFPVPKWIRTIINAPMQLLLRKDNPATKSEAAGVTSFYTVILILLSLFWVDLGTEKPQQVLISSANTQHQIDSLITEIRNTPRRYLHKHFNSLKNMGDVSVKPLINLLYDPDPVLREFSANALGELKADTATVHIIRLIDDSNFRVRNSAIYALGKMESEKSLEPLISVLSKPTGPGQRHFIYSALGGIGSEKAIDVLIKGTEDSVWFVKNSAINAICKINIDKASRFVERSLKDNDTRVRRSSVYLILKYKIKNLKEAVKTLLNDEDFETRFYSKIILERL